MNISQSLINSFIPSNQEAAVKIQAWEYLQASQRSFTTAFFSFPSPHPRSASLAGIKMTQEGKTERAADLVKAEMQTPFISTTEKHQLSVPTNQVSLFLSHSHPLKTHY